ncbi:MAG: hypothetical protein Q9211_007204, partial [Gyalolechia sp. 1 TL-2023]
GDLSDCEEVKLEFQDDGRKRSRCQEALPPAPNPEGPARFPTEEIGIRILRRNLETMGCAGFMDVAWGIKDGNLVTKLMGDPDNRYNESLRAHQERRTYNFRRGEVKVAERSDELMEGEFMRGADPKDGYTITDLKDAEARLVLGFLNPIFYPEKPRRIVTKWACTFLEAMRGKITVDWATLMNELVCRLIRNLPKAKKAGTPLPLYITHLYVKHEILTPTEQDEYEELLNIQKYGGPETDVEEGSDTSRSPVSSLEARPRSRKRTTSVQKNPEPEVAGPSEEVPEPANPE